MGLELTREEKENLVARVADLAFDDMLNKVDAAAIIEVCLNACKRNAAEIEEMIGPACDIIQ